MNKDIIEASGKPANLIASLPTQRTEEFFARLRAQAREPVMHVRPRPCPGLRSRQNAAARGADLKTQDCADQFSRSLFAREGIDRCLAMELALMAIDYELQRRHMMQEWSDMVDAWIEGRRHTPVLVPASMPIFEPDPSL